MYLITIINWRRKLIYLTLFFIIISLAVIIVPQMFSNNTVETDSQPLEEEMLTKPIKVQSIPNIDEKPILTPQK